MSIEFDEISYVLNSHSNSNITTLQARIWIDKHELSFDLMLTPPTYSTNSIFPGKGCIQSITGLKTWLSNIPSLERFWIQVPADPNGAK